MALGRTSICSFGFIVALAIGSHAARAADLLVPAPEPVPVPDPVPVPVGVPVPVFVPVPVPLLPFLAPPPVILPSPTLFSPQRFGPIPVRPQPHGRTAAEAEAAHYGYGQYLPSPRPLGFYRADGAD